MRPNLWNGAQHEAPSPADDQPLVRVSFDRRASATSLQRSDGLRRDCRDPQCDEEVSRVAPELPTLAGRESNRETIRTLKQDPVHRQKPGVRGDIECIAKGPCRLNLNRRSPGPKSARSCNGSDARACAHPYDTETGFCRSKIETPV